jgi:hypothetical protein
MYVQYNYFKTLFVLLRIVFFVKLTMTTFNQKSATDEN